MSKAVNSNYDIMSAVYGKDTPAFDNRISLKSREMWDATGVLLAADNYRDLRNQIFTDLVNRIALTKVISKSFNNPLSMYKRGMMNYGDTIQEIASDVIEEQSFQSGFTNQFEVTKPNVSAVYHRINRQSLYTTTVEDPQMKYAFVNPEGLHQLISSIISQLDKSNTIDEYVYTKKLFESYFDNNEVPIIDSQKLVVPDVRNGQRDRDKVLSVIEKIKFTMRDMQFPNRKYNSKGNMSQTSAEDSVILLRNDFAVVNEVYNLSSAFNPEYMDLKVPIISLDEVVPNNNKIIGCIMSNSAVDIRDTLNTTTMASNAKSLYTNYFYHVHQIYTFSPYENCVFIMEE